MLVPRNARLVVLASVVVLSRCNCSDSIGSAEPDVPDIDVCVVPSPGAPEVCYQTMKRDRRDELCAGTEECRLPELAIDLGAFPANTNGSTPVRVKNVGKAPLKLFNPKPAPGASIMYRLNPAQTAAGEGVYATLKPEEEFTFNVELRGTLCGEQKARFVLTSNDAELPPNSPASFNPGQPDTPIYLDVTGRVSGPCLCPIGGGVLDFGRVPVGRGTVKRFSFESCGDAPLTVSNTEIGQDPSNVFDLVGTVYPAGDTLQPGEQGHVDVKYTPVQLAPPPDVGELWLSTNAPTAQPYFPVELVGEGSPRPACVLGALPADASYGFVEDPTERQFRVFNQGQIACRFTSVQRTSGSAEFSLTSGDPTPYVTLAPNQSHMIGITYSPNDESSDEAVFTATADDIDGFTSTATIHVSGNPTFDEDGCVLDIQPDFGDFGEISVGQTAQVTFNLKNIGTGNFLTDRCTINSAVIVGPDATEYRLGELGFISVLLPPEGALSSSVTVYFEPLSQGIKNATLRFSSNSLTGSTRDVPLWGNALGATLCVDLNGATPATTPYDPANPPTVDYGAVAVGSEAVRNITLTNCGAGTLNLRGITMDPAGGLAFIKEQPTSADMPIALTPNQSTNLRIKYRPTAPGGDFGAADVLSISQNADVARINLRGNYNGDCPRVIRCNPSAIGFGTQDVNTTGMRTAVCTNFGSERITVNNITATGDPAIRLASSTYFEVEPGETFGVQLSCTPTSAGDKAAQVSIVSTACERSPYVMTAACTGIVPDLPQCIGSDTYTPITKWHWSGQSLPAQFNDVWMTPVVINLTDDNGDGVIDQRDIPDVVFTAFHSQMAPMDGPDISGALDPSPAYAVAVRGDNGQTLWTFGVMPTSDGDPNAVAFDSEAQLAVGDIDADGRPEIVGVKYTYIPPRECDMSDPECQFKGRFVYGSLLALEHDGTFKWESERWHMDEWVAENMGGPSLGDMDGDGIPEIAFGNAIYDNNGVLVFEGVTAQEGVQGDGEGGAGHGPISLFVDLTGDGMVELLCGRTAFRKDGSKVWDRTDLKDGLAVVANLDSDNFPEIVLLTGGNDLLVLEHTGQTKYGPLHIVSGNTDENGQSEGFIATNPAVGDVDGDGFPEIVVAATNFIYVFEHDLTEKWRGTISDQTGASGPTTFDFEGDGRAEVVHADESTLWIFDGVNGAVKYSAERASRTIADNPVVADVDNDGHAELIISSESILGGFSGVIAYGNDKNNWVGTLRVWNQHTYHVSNVSESGVIPAVEGSGWTTNNVFRSNVVRCE